MPPKTSYQQHALDALDAGHFPSLTESDKARWHQCRALVFALLEIAEQLARFNATTAHERDLNDPTGSVG